MNEYIKKKISRQYNFISCCVSVWRKCTSDRHANVMSAPAPFIIKWQIYRSVVIVSAFFYIVTWLPNDKHASLQKNVVVESSRKELYGQPACLACLCQAGWLHYKSTTYQGIKKPTHYFFFRFVLFLFIYFIFYDIRFDLKKLSCSRRRHTSSSISSSCIFSCCLTTLTWDKFCRISFYDQYMTFIPLYET